MGSDRVVAQPIATHAGLREVPGAPISEARAAAVAAQLAEYLTLNALPGALAVGHDRRPRGRELAAAAIRGARAAGADVLDVGLASTPATKLAARRRGLGGALVVTGSHLEPELTGIKLSVAPDLAPLDPRELPLPAPFSPQPGRTTSAPAAAEEHAHAVAAAVDADAVRAAGLSVGCTGETALGAAELFARLGCRDPDGGAAPDLGIELDADGDRLRLDARGVRLEAEATLPLVALARGPRTLVRSTDTSRATDLLLGRARIVTVAPGELHLVRALASAGADALAGEGNGGVVVPEIGLARDGLAAAACVLELVARTGVPLDELAARIPVLERRRGAVPGTFAREVLDAADGVAGAQRARDGSVTIERGEGLWGLVRASATEPVVRVTVEGPDAASVDELYTELVERAEAGAPGPEPASAP
jgi:phosphomannomutase